MLFAILSAAIGFQIKFTAGVHSGTSDRIAGSVNVDPAAQVVSAKLSVPIDSLRTGSDKRDCHMREALGLDYSKSRFPGDHVCDSGNRIPAEGPDAIAFPAIEFELLSFQSGTPVTLEPGRSFEIVGDGTFTLHGNSVKTSGIPLAVTVLADGKLGVKGKLSLSLKDFGVVVKPYFGMKVVDTAHVDLDLVLGQ